MSSEVSAIVLAGGQSRRLGLDKIALRIDGKTLLERTVELMASLSSDVLIVTNAARAPRHPLARTVADLLPGRGVLGGIYTGLVMAAYPYALVVAADMPFLNRALLEYLVNLSPHYDVVVPVIEGQAEPLHAVYSRTCREPIERQLQAQTTPRVVSFFGDVRVRTAAKDEIIAHDPELLSLFNINTPADLERARSILRSQGSDITLPQE